MLLVTVAMMMEARPLCACLGLKAVSGHPYPVFQNKKTILVVAGTGPLNASAATGWALGHFPRISLALNIGFAGASSQMAPVHSWRYIHSIRDESSGHLCIPDILLNHPFQESTLLTVGKVLREDIGWKGLVDMEGSGFYQAARRALPPDRIMLLKWVSDNLTGDIDIKETTVAFEHAMGEIDEFLDMLELEAARDEAEVSSPYLDIIQQKARLTRTQVLFLEKWLSGYLARGGDWQNIADLLPLSAPRHKADNAHLFEQLKNVLKG
jgi:hypothetical protein